VTLTSQPTGRCFHKKKAREENFPTIIQSPFAHGGQEKTSM